MHCKGDIIDEKIADLGRRRSRHSHTCLLYTSKRKNWYVDMSVIPEQSEVALDKEYRIEKFHSGGKGGQNVNKVETGAVSYTHLDVYKRQCPGRSLCCQVIRLQVSYCDAYHDTLNESKPYEKLRGGGCALRRCL